MLPVRGDGATLERALRLTMEQRTTGETPILLADCGLDETGAASGAEPDAAIQPGCSFARRRNWKII